MQYKESLYKLIKSLNGPEKSYFKKYAKRHSLKGKSVYLRLFEIIEENRSSGEFDGKFLRSSLKKYTTTTNLSVLKSYLYKMILKSMESFYYGGDTTLLINSELESFRFLFTKNLFKEAGEVLSKAKKIAIDHHRYEKLYEVLKKERMLTNKTDPANIELVKKINHEAIDASEKLKIDAEYNYLNDLVTSLVNKFGIGNFDFLKDKFDKILESRFLKSNKHAKTFLSLLFFYQIHATYQFMLSNYEKCLELFSEMLTHFESNPHMMKIYLKNYAITVLNCLDMCEILRYYDQYDKYYKKFSDLMNNKAFKIPEPLLLSIMSRMYILEIKKFTTMGKFDENRREIKEMESNVERDLKKINSQDRVILIFQFAMYYFGCRNYNRSLKWLNLIINKDEEIRRDLRIECRLLFLIIHFELGNYDFLEYAVLSTYRYILKSGNLRGIEPLIIYFIKKTAKISNTNELKKLFEDLYLKMKKSNEIIEEYGFKYMYWIESKLLEESYGEIMRRKYIESRTQAEIEKGANFTFNFESKELRENLDAAE